MESWCMKRWFGTLTGKGNVHYTALNVMCVTEDNTSYAMHTVKNTQMILMSLFIVSNEWKRLSPNRIHPNDFWSVLQYVYTIRLVKLSLCTNKRKIVWLLVIHLYVVLVVPTFIVVLVRFFPFLSFYQTKTREVRVHHLLYNAKFKKYTTILLYF